MGRMERSREGDRESGAVFEHCRVGVVLKGQGFRAWINHPHAQSTQFPEHLSTTGQVLLRVGAALIQAWSLCTGSL